MGNQMVGHLKREIVAKLSPLIDSNLIAVDGVMDDGNMNGGALAYTLPMYVFRSFG
jgi:SWI/SNF-related matrix-associated actin-dependent regulator of chromatin subfamily A3